MRTTVANCLPLLVPLLCVIGCGENRPVAPPLSEIGSGRVEERTYEHEYFGLRIAIPEEWTILGDNFRRAVANADIEDIRSKTGIDIERVDPNEADSGILLTLLERQGVLFTTSASTFIITADHIPADVPVPDGPALMDGVLHSYKHANPRAIVDSGRETRKVGDVVMYQATAMTNASNRETDAIILAAQVRGYVITIVASSTGGTELPRLEELISSIEFAPPSDDE